MPQSEPIPGKNQVKNSAGGYSWGIDDWGRLDRFLILGSEGGSYYASEKELTIKNAEAVLRCIKADSARVVNRVVEISEAGRAPKNDPAIFVLAMVAGMGDEKGRQAAFKNLSSICRTGTHLFSFVEEVEKFRGWGRGLKNAVAKWYLDKDPSQLAYQVVKYRQRGGWSHRDLLRLAHVKSEALNDIFHWIVKGDISENLHQLILDFEKLQRAESEKEILETLSGNKSLTWEMIPTEYLKSPAVWEVLLPNLPMTAMIRNLGRMTANGLLKPFSSAVTTAVSKITDEENLKKARIHPIAVLAALCTYQKGCGIRGSLSWEPVPHIIDALDKAFYLSFQNVEPTAKRWMLALDVSSSMNCGAVASIPGLTPRMASAALAMVTARTEKKYHFTAFSHQLIPVSISPRQRLDDVVKQIDEIPFGGTDCSLPMFYAMAKKIPVDTFVVYTDSETWAGHIHPSQALNEYRRKMGIAAKLVVVGMVSNGFTIADPDDAGMLDVVGFDTATPALISDFGKGE